MTHDWHFFEIMPIMGIFHVISYHVIIPLAKYSDSMQILYKSLKNMTSQYRLAVILMLRLNQNRTHWQIIQFQMGSTTFLPGFRSSNWYHFQSQIESGQRLCFCKYRKWFFNIYTQMTITLKIKYSNYFANWLITLSSISILQLLKILLDIRVYEFMECMQF